MLSVLAVYENGVLRPKQPLDLVEGQTVEITVNEPAKAETSLSEEEINHRLRDAKTFQEWFEATKLLPQDDGGYDIVQALNENRKWSGERPLTPEKDANK